MARCPNCGSYRFEYVLRSAGTYATNRPRAGIRTYQSKRKQKAVGICHNCGYIEEKKEKVERDAAFYIMCICFFPISLSILFLKTDKVRLKRKWRVLVVTCFWLLFFILGITTQDQNDSSSELIVDANYAELTDFNYRISDNSLILKSYKGHSTKVSISPSYIADGKALPVTELDGTFILKPINSAIIPEGVTRISSDTFSSCSVKKLYLPVTLREFVGWESLCKVQEIYYGGTEEQWNALFNGDHPISSNVQIFFGVDVKTLITD